MAVRDHFRLEIEQKLRRRAYPEEEIAAAMAELEGRKYLDEAQAARSYVRGRRAKGYGRARVAAELAARGVAGDLAREVLGELMPEDDTEAARTAARRSPAKDAAALARRLERKGFSGRAIRTVVQEWDD